MRINFYLIACLLLALCLSCQPSEKSIPKQDDQPKSTQSSIKEGIDSNPLKEAYFGETHLHTSFSLDAFIGGNRMTPEEALRFAQGEELELPKLGKKVQLERPLDFAAVTDHAEYIGEMYSILYPGAPGYDDPQSKQFREVQSYKEAEKLFLDVVVKSNRSATPQHPPMYKGVTTTMSAWKIMNQATENQYKPGKFTTLHAFEWSGAPNGGNLHRNIIFRDTIVPDLPISYIEVNREPELWEWLETISKNGSTVLAIPHNSNASKGMMFDENMPNGMPITEEYAKSRAKWERTIEMMQIKGNSEVHPDFWPNDEFADFEIAYSLADYSGRTFEEKNYVRYGLKKGLEYKAKLGVNPFKLGFNGGTDNHNGEMSNVEEDNYTGSHGLADNTAADRLNNEIPGWAKAYDVNPGSLTGVWAPRNTRSDIWDALYNRETFATSGPRIKVRFFAGYGYKNSYDNYESFVQDGYEKGVPMGSDLPLDSGKEPSFLVWAQKDPMNTTLDRVQVIKGWYEDGELKELTYNVAVSDERLKADGKVLPTDVSVNLETGETDANEKGANEFMVTWKDPDFDPGQLAFYYVRVIQMPTARWTLWDEIRSDVKFPDDLAKTIQERAWSSPIWYTPEN